VHRAAYNAELCRTRSPATGLGSGNCWPTHAAHTTLSETWRRPASSPLSRRAGRAGGMAAAQACCCLAGSSSRRCTAETACTARRHTAAQPEETKLCALLARQLPDGPVLPCIIPESCATTTSVLFPRCLCFRWTQGWCCHACNGRSCGKTLWGGPASASLEVWTKRWVVNRWRPVAVGGCGGAAE